MATGKDLVDYIDACYLLALVIVLLPFAQLISLVYDITIASTMRML